MVKKLIIILCSLLSLEIYAMGDHVTSLDKKKSDSFIMQNSVILISAFSKCSGVQVRISSTKTFLMSSAHCSDLQDAAGNVRVVTFNNKITEQHILSIDKEHDLMLLTSVPILPGIEIAKVYGQNSDIRAFGGGRSHPIYKVLGTLIELEKPFGYKVYNMVSTAAVTQGMSGGPVVTDSGLLVGIISAVDDQYPFYSYFVTLDQIHEFISKQK